jgi:hypothetical protein
MKMKRLTVAVVTGALVAAGAGAAIGATSGDGKKAEDAILSDAAKRLDVTPQRLRDALGAAEDAQLDQAVKDGDLTQKQADAIKARRRQSGRVLGGPRGPHGPGFGGRGRHGGPGGPGFGRGPGGGPGAIFGAIAKELGISTAKLAAELRSGKTLAEVAKAHDKSVGDLKTAAKAAVEKDLDQAVKDGDLTRKQADAMLAHVDEHLDRLGEARGFGPRRFHDRRDRDEDGGGATRPGAAPMEPAPGVFS